MLGDIIDSNEGSLRTWLLSDVEHSVNPCPIYICESLCDDFLTCNKSEMLAAARCVGVGVSRTSTAGSVHVDE